MKPIERAIEAAGGSQKVLALAIGVTPQAVNQWVLGLRPVPAKHCIAIEDAAGGQVTRHDLRPDVFGEAPDSLRRTPAANEGDAAGADELKTAA